MTGKFRMKTLISILLILVMASPATADNVMKFAFGNGAAPFAFEEDGVAKGILIDIAREAIENRMGITVAFNLHPWKRAQHLVKQGVLDAHITYGPSRTAWAEHGNEVVVTYAQKFYVKAGGPKFEELKKVKILEDLKPFKLIQHRGDSWVQKSLLANNYDVHLVADYDTMFKLLAKGRGDGIAFEPYMSRYIIKNLGLSEQIVELDVGFTGQGYPFHLVVGKKSPYIKIIPQFDETFREMKQDGTYQKIIASYR